jgi:hypothetical protein
MGSTYWEPRVHFDKQSKSIVLRGYFLKYLGPRGLVEALEAVIWTLNVVLANSCYEIIIFKGALGCPGKAEGSTDMGPKAHFGIQL